MFFNSSKGNYLFLEETEVEVDVKVEPSETDLTGDEAGVTSAIEESTEIWYNLREKMMRLEHAAIMREKDGLVSEAHNLLEAGVQGFFDRVSDLFRKMREWLAEIWKKFVATIMSWVASDKAFCNKYEKVLRGKNLSGFGSDLNVISWKTGDLASPVLQGMRRLVREAEEFMGWVNQARDDRDLMKMREISRDEEFITYLQNRLLAGSGGSEFKTKIKESFTTNKSLDKGSLSTVNISDMLATVKDNNRNLKEARKAYKDIDTVFDKAQKYYKGLAKKFKNAKDSKDGDDIRGVSYGSSRGKAEFDIEQSSIYYRTDTKDYQREAATLSASAVKRLSKICQQAFGVLISAIKERNRTFRSILAKAVYYKADKNASYNFSGSILDKF